MAGEMCQNLLAPAGFLCAYRSASLSPSLVSVVLDQENGSFFFTQVLSEGGLHVFMNQRNP